MATHFFEQQDRARRNTSVLVFLFILAAIAMTLTLYLLAVLATGYRGQDPRTGQMVFDIVWLNPELILQVGLLTGIVIGGASLYRIRQLSGGGRVVAEGMGGRLLHNDASDALERKILNIVEEMAIASGTPCPPVYLMDQEMGINAFAAGFSPSDAVIGVTRGCVEQLSRDELQGVIAHEFSHILNGDMRLNIRLMGVLYGILVLGMIGYYLLRSSFWAGAGSRRNSKDNSALMMAAAGAALMAVGMLGTLAGNLIKASVSRQREFLADASAVQFTRNPAGIAGALKKIGGFDAGSKIENPAATESSHLFFGQALSSGLNSLFATHPPLAERIKVLDPSWQGAMTEGTANVTAAQSAAVSGFAQAPPAANAVDQIGQVSGPHLDYAAQLLKELPPRIHEAAHDTFSARAVVYALLLDADLESRKVQLEILDAKGEDGVPALTRKILPEIEALGPRFRLLLIDIALPALRSLSNTQYVRFKGLVVELVEADKRIELFEWALQRILLTHLAPSFEVVKPARGKLRSQAQLRQVLAVILSTLAYEGNLPSDDERRKVVDRAGRNLIEDGVALLPPEDVGLVPLDEALGYAAAFNSNGKEALLRGCAEVIAADGNVGEAEAEFFRAIGDTLGCPVPLLLPGQALG